MAHCRESEAHDRLIDRAIYTRQGRVAAVRSVQRDQQVTAFDHLRGRICQPLLREENLGLIPPDLR